MIITVPYHSKYNERIYPMFGHERPGYNVEEMRTILAPHNLSIAEVSSYEYAFGRIPLQYFQHDTFRPPHGGIILSVLYSLTFSTPRCGSASLTASAFKIRRKS